VALYTKDSVDRVKQALDIVEVVGAQTELRRVGRRFTGLCPFHDERTPSFSVNQELGLYHCFGCRESGDAIKFVQKTESLDFRQAVELLADRYGVELQREQEDPRAEERRRRRERLLGLVERTAAYYARYLWEAREAQRARDYLAGRGLGEEVLRAFRVGYAPSAWDRVLVRARNDGFTVEELAAAGLGRPGSGGGFYDRFRGRIMFPLADARGRVLGFGARAVREEQRPKYLNTTDNELYHKGRQLFGIDRARAAAAKAGTMVVVEGYTDVLALHQAGIEESVAIMGTALTQEQLAELHRAAGTVCLALDADRSGQEAMLRAGRAAQARGLELRVVSLPEGRDPADLVADDGAGAIRDLLTGAITVAEFEVRRTLSEADLDTPAGRDRALEAARPLIAAAPARSATRDELARYVADRLDVPTAYLMTHLSAPASVHREGGRRGAPVSEPVPAGWAPPPGGSPDGDSASQAAVLPIDVAVRAERSFLATCLSRPQLGREYLERLDDEHLSSPALRRVRRHLVEHLEAPLSGLADDDPALAAGVAEIAMLADEAPSSEAALRLGFLQLELRRLERALRDAGQRSDHSRQLELSREREGVRGELSALMGEAV
jgi:DNA primase